ncbi:MAG TPA: hypothetical protein VNM48_04440 [Chloroflexota bacterium]|nr:hypothetical protein [Chloroflexota bacterium]
MQRGGATTEVAQLRIGQNPGRLARSGVFGAPYSGALPDADVGPADLQDLLDQEVHQRRLRLATQSGSSDETAINAPITDAERDTVLTDLLIQTHSDAPLDELSTTAKAGSAARYLPLVPVPEM